MTAVPDQANGELGAQLLKLVSAHDGQLGIKALAARTKQKTKRTVKLAMEALAAKGLVHAVGTRRYQVWHLGAKGASRAPAPAKEAVR